jgi:predicted metal-dependent hydrolase
MRAISNIISSTVSSELTFTAGGRRAALQVRHSPRAKLMRLRIDPRTGDVLLTVPRRVSTRRALAWAAGQRNWIEAALAAMPDPVPVAPGMAVPLYGEPHALEWREGAPRSIRVEPGRISVGGPLDMVPSRLLRWLRDHARGLLAEETRAFAELAGVEVPKVGVGDPVSRWGSCSARGSIRYSWRLILAPEWVRRATVAHEVAHRVHLNHGPDFHALVEELLGEDPARARGWLRRNGALLHGFGRL